MPTIRQSSVPKIGPSAMTRTLRLHQRLADGSLITAASLANELEVSNRTIKRDIERLRDFHGAPVVWDAALHSYRYTHACPELPLLHFTTQEGLAIALANETFSAWRGSVLGTALSSAFGKIGSALGNSVTFASGDLGQLVTSSAPDSSTDFETRSFPTVLEAALKKRVLSFEYHKPHESPERRSVYPLHLARLEQRWVLIAWDPKKLGARRFLLTRMNGLLMEGASFTFPDSFDLKAHLRGSFGLYNGTEAIPVLLRFDSYAAPFIRERQWHSTQSLTPLPDGSIELKLSVTHLVDVRRWVLSWGRHAEALEPSQLRNEIKAEVTELARSYQEDPS